MSEPRRFLNPGEEASLEDVIRLRGTMGNGEPLPKTIEELEARKKEVKEQLESEGARPVMATHGNLAVWGSGGLVSGGTVSFYWTGQNRDKLKFRI